jgi:lipid-A-disaccharide synthase
MDAANSLKGYKKVILASTVVKEMITEAVPADTLIVEGNEKADLFAAATLALSKSGTVTLELAAAQVPMVVAYKTGAVSAWLIRRMILIKYASLVNIAVNNPIVPELLQERCNAADIGAALNAISAPLVMAQQRKSCAEAIKILQGDITEDPNVIAARTVLRCLAS